jgi:hypothetical protein
MRAGSARIADGLAQPDAVFPQLRPGLTVPNNIQELSALSTRPSRTICCGATQA